MTAATHPVTPQELMALLDGELSAERAQSVSSHTESCANCQQAFASLLQTSRSLMAWTVVPASSQIEDRINVVPDSSQTVGASAIRRWSRKRWTIGLTLAAATLLLALFVATPNRLRSKMAANEAVAVGRERLHEKAMREVSEMNLPPAAAARSVDRTEVNGRRSKVFSNKIPMESAASSFGSLVTMTSPGVAADTNGLMHGLDDHAQNSISVDGQPNQQSQTFSGPMIARTASLVVVVKDFNASRQRIDAILGRHDGYAASMTVNTPEEAARSLQASLRVPVPQLAATMAELKVLGRVETENQNGEEVTQQHADLVARLKISRETEQRFMSILRDWKGDINQALSAEQAIARVRGEIEQMEAEQKNLEHRVDFATIDLNLSEEYKAKLESPAPSFSTRFHNAVVSGLRNIADTLAALILFFAEYGPVLIFWAILLLIPAWLVWRRWRQAVTVTPAT